MSYGIKQNGEYKKVAGNGKINTWTGTQEEWEETDIDTLPVGTYVNITDETIPKNDKKKRVICIGDSYNKDTEMWDGWGKCLKSMNPNIDVYSYEAGGGGFVANTYQYDFLGALQNHSQDIAVPDDEKNLITDIIVLGCYNDMSVQATQEQINAKVSEFMSYCKANYPNAKVTISSISIDYNSAENMNKINIMANMYRIAARLYGAKYFEHFKFILRNKNKIYFSDTNPNSGFHPNSLGNTTVANYINEYLYSGYFDVKDGALQCSAFVYSMNGNICISPSPENGGVPTTMFLNNEMNGKSFPFNTWVDLGDVSNSNGENLLWGAINGVTAYWQANVIKQTTPTSNEYCSTMVFRLLNKHIYANNLSNTNTLVFDGSIWTIGMSNLYFDDQLIY